MSKYYVLCKRNFSVDEYSISLCDDKTEVENLIAELLKDNDELRTEDIIVIKGEKVAFGLEYKISLFEGAKK